MSDLTKALATHREKAEAATEGPWHVFQHRNGDQVWADGKPVANYGGVARYNAQHIAANDPSTTLVFISVAEAAEEVMDNPGNGYVDLRAALDNLSTLLQPDPATKEKT